MRREGTIEFVNRRLLVKRPESLVHEPVLPTEDSLVRELQPL